MVTVRAKKNSLLVEYMWTHGEITTNQAAALLDASPKTAWEYLDRLVAEGVAERADNYIRSAGAVYRLRFVTDEPPPLWLGRACDCSGDFERNPVAYEVIAPAPNPTYWIEVEGQGAHRNLPARPAVFLLCADCAEYEKEMAVPGVTIRPLGEGE